MTAWNRSEDDYLRKHKGLGEGATLIGVALGRSRNSVMGHAERLRLGKWHTIKKAKLGTMPPRQRTMAEKAKKYEPRIRVAPKHEPQLSKEEMRRMFEDAWRNTVDA